MLGLQYKLHKVHVKRETNKEKHNGFIQNIRCYLITCYLKSQYCGLGVVSCRTGSE